MNPCVIRLAAPPDAAAINEILNYYVLHSTATFVTEPIALPERLLWLEQHQGPHPAVVALVAGAMVGWGALSPFRGRAAYAKTVELSVYIRRDQHRRGFGRAIVADLLERARTLGHHAVVGGCCSESGASIALLQSFGFSGVGRFPEVGRKFDRWLDVIFLQLLL